MNILCEFFNMSVNFIRILIKDIEIIHIVSRFRPDPAHLFASQPFLCSSMMNDYNIPDGRRN